MPLRGKLTTEKKIGSQKLALRKNENLAGTKWKGLCTQSYPRSSSSKPSI